MGIAENIKHNLSYQLASWFGAKCCFAAVIFHKFKNIITKLTPPPPPNN